MGVEYARAVVIFQAPIALCQILNLTFAAQTEYPIKDFKNTTSFFFSKKS